MRDAIRIEIAYADADRQILRALDVPQACTVAQALQASAIAAELPAGTIDGERLGIFSERVTLQTPLRDGDRIEIYRSLQADPKDSRRRRAGKA